MSICLSTSRLSIRNFTSTLIICVYINDEHNLVYIIESTHSIPFSLALKFHFLRLPNSRKLCRIEYHLLLHNLLVPVVLVLHLALSSFITVAWGLLFHFLILNMYCLSRYLYKRAKIVKGTTLLDNNNGLGKIHAQRGNPNLKHILSTSSALRPRAPDNGRGILLYYRR